MTGAAGMLGRDLVPHLAARHDVVGVDMEVDVTDPVAIGDCVREVAPQAVFHLAAWTDVDGAEEREQDAEAVNAGGSGNVAAAAAGGGRRRVGGAAAAGVGRRAGRGGGADDAPNPLGAYGRTKLAGEHAALAAHPGGTRIARTAWLYGAHGRNFVDTMRGLGAERDEVSVVDDQEGSPTWTCDLAPALEALLDQPPGVYHTAGGGAVTWAGFARAIFEEAGIACRVRPITTGELGRPAPRPARSPLAVTRPGAPRLRPWREALRDYLKEAV